MGSCGYLWLPVEGDGLSWGTRDSLISGSWPLVVLPVTMNDLNIQEKKKVIPFFYKLLS